MAEAMATLAHLAPEHRLHVAFDVCYRGTPGSPFLRPSASTQRLLASSQRAGKRAGRSRR